MSGQVAIATLFLAGDIRANEQVGLTSMQTLFLHEHNRLAALIADEHPELTGQEIFEMARKIVGAEVQAITFHDFLPLLLGPGAIEPYSGYDPDVDPSIAMEFSTAGFRIGHTVLSPRLLRIGADGERHEHDPYFLVNPELLAQVRGPWLTSSDATPRSVTNCPMSSSAVSRPSLPSRRSPAASTRALELPSS